MKNIKNLLSRLDADESGLSTVEYIILLVLIAVLAIGAWSAFGGAVNEKVKGAESTFTDTLDNPGN